MAKVSAARTAKTEKRTAAARAEPDRRAALLGPGLHAAGVDARTSDGFRVRTLDGQVLDATLDAGVEDALVAECLRHGRRVLVADGASGPVVLGALQTTRTVGYERDGSLRLSGTEVGIKAEGMVRLETGQVTITLDPRGNVRMEGNKMVVDMSTLVRFLAARLELP